MMLQGELHWKLVGLNVGHVIRLRQLALFNVHLQSSRLKPMILVWILPHHQQFLIGTRKNLTIPLTLILGLLMGNMMQLLELGQWIQVNILCTNVVMP